MHLFCAQYFTAIIWVGLLQMRTLGLIKILGWPKSSSGYFPIILWEKLNKLFGPPNHDFPIVTQKEVRLRCGSCFSHAPFYCMLPCARRILGICGVCYMSQYTQNTIKQIFSFSPLKILRSHHPFSSFETKALVFRFLFYIPFYRVSALIWDQ